MTRGLIRSAIGARFVALLVAVFLLCGCPSATTHIKGDDATVERAVRAEKALYAASDTLFTLEKKFRGDLEPLVPGLHAAVDGLKWQSETVISTLRTFTKLYREAPASAKPDYKAVIDRSEGLSKEVEDWLTRVALAAPKEK